MDFVKETLNKHRITESGRAIVDEFENILKKVTESEISFYFKHSSRNAKSISESISKTIEDYTISNGWNRSVPIFNDKNISKSLWSFEYQKGNVGIIVSFGHFANIIKNITISIIATEDNQLKKSNEIDIVIIVGVTNKMKKSGGFDGVVGSYERYLESLIPMQGMIRAPLIIYGLKEPKSFRIMNKQIVDNKKPNFPD